MKSQNLFIAMALALGLVNTYCLISINGEVKELTKWVSELSLNVGDIQKTLAAEMNQQYIDHSDGDQ